MRWKIFMLISLKAFLSSCAGKAGWIVKKERRNSDWEKSRITAFECVKASELPSSTHFLQHFRLNPDLLSCLGLLSAGWRSGRVREGTLQ